jgi:hypothetical protein
LNTHKQKRLTEQEKKDFNHALVNSNRIISEQPEDGEISSKVLWEKPFYCNEKGCQKKTCLTRRLNVSIIAKMIGKEVSDFYEPLCKKHYEITHAYGLVKIAEFDKEVIL